MSKSYLFNMFILCFCIWAVVVDNVLLPDEKQLKQDIGQFSRYRVKEWNKGRKLDIIDNELLIYVVVKNREQLYYMEHKLNYEAALNYLAPGAPLQVRYNRGFPKFWKRHVYSIRQNGLPVVSYSPAHVRSGAVASIYSSPVDIGRHLAMLINQALKKKPDTGTPFQFARFYSITTNSRIATALGINLPAERDLRSTLDKLGP